MGTIENSLIQINFTFFFIPDLHLLDLNEEELINVGNNNATDVTIDDIISHPMFADLLNEEPPLSPLSADSNATTIFDDEKL